MTAPVSTMYKGIRRRAARATFTVLLATAACLFSVAAMATVTAVPSPVAARAYINVLTSQRHAAPEVPLPSPEPLQISNAPNPFADVIRAADLPQEWRAQLNAPALVHLIHGGQPVRGRLLGIRYGKLHLRLIDAGGGSGEAAIALERIRQIDFPGQALWTVAEATQTDLKAAYALRVALYLEYAKALPFVDRRTAERFAALAEESARTEERTLQLFALHVAMTTSLSLQAETRTNPLPPAQLEHLSALLDDAMLLSLWQLGLREEAIANATQRSELSLSGAGSLGWFRSALPHSLLAADALQRNDSEAALELALTPILLGKRPTGAEQPRHLAAAYAVAITAAKAQGQSDLIGRLTSEADAAGITPAPPVPSLLPR